MKVEIKNLRILLIAPQPFYEDRGTPIVISDELRILSSLGFQVDVATFPIGTNLKIPNVQIIRSANPLKFRYVPIGFSLRKVFLDLFLLLTALRLAYRNHYNCIHGVEEGSAIGVVCKVIFGMPIIYDMHSSIPEQLSKINFFKKCLGRKIALDFEKLLIGNADAILASIGLANYILSIAPNKPVWECFFFSNIPHKRNEALAHRLGVFERPTILYTGNFSSYQGLDLLIEAAAIMRFVIPDVMFLLVGGTKSDIQSIARLVKMNNLERTVKLIHRVHRSEVAEYLTLADVLILPRRKGLNAPLKIFDYMRSQKPIVATDIPAHRAMLSEKTAFLVKPEAKALANGLICVIKDKKLSNKLALEAITTVRNLKINSLIETLIEAYEFILKTEH